MSRRGKLVPIVAPNGNSTLNCIEGIPAKSSYICMYREEEELLSSSSSCRLEELVQPAPTLHTPSILHIFFFA